MNRTILLILLLALPAVALRLGAQEPRKLVKVENALAAVLGGAENDVTAAVVQAETDKSMTVQIELRGFRDKKYKIRASVLNSAKKPLREIEPVETDLDSRSALADLAFTARATPGKVYSQPSVESAYLQVNIYNPDDPLATLGGDLNLSGNIFQFQCKKKWKISGAASTQVVTIDLAPLKSAATIKPQN